MQTTNHHNHHNEPISVTYFATPDTLTVIIDSRRYTVDRSLPNAQEALDKLRNGDFTMDDIPLVDATPSDILIMDGIVLRNGYLILEADDGITYELSGPIVDRLRNDPPSTLGGLRNFLRKCAANPRPEAILELYDFLAATGLPIGADGDFYAYKKVNTDFTDIHTGRMSNAPGQVVTMERDDVDDDRNRTCSSGLHFAGHDYLDHYGLYNTSRTVMVKINPADVVAIPADYNNQKGRCCRYEVISAIDDGRRLEQAWYDNDNDDDEEDNNDED